LQEFTQELKNLILETIRGVHTAIPAKVVSYDPDKCEVDVLPFGKFRKPDGELLDYPQISGVPVYFVQARGRTVTIAYPINPGDECLLLFAEQALDIWKNGGAESDTELRFDLINAIALVGLFAKANPIAKRASDNESIIVQREETFVEIYDGKFETEIRNKDIAVSAYHLMVDGITDTLEFTVKSTDDEKTISINIDGNEGSVYVKTKGKIRIESDEIITMVAPKIELNP